VCNGLVDPTHVYLTSKPYKQGSDTRQSVTTGAQTAYLERSIDEPYQSPESQEYPDTPISVVTSDWSEIRISSKGNSYRSSSVDSNGRISLSQIPECSKEEHKCLHCSVQAEETVHGGLRIQSDTVPIGTMGTTEQEEETLTFHDTNRGDHDGLQRAIDPSMRADETIGADLRDFFSRPVRIASFTWNESDAVGTSHTFDPWNLYFTDARVKYKLNNFAFINCSLEIKILVNASPFYYGAMLASYQPLPTLTPSTIVNDAGTRYFIPYSQRPHVWLEPTGNKGGSLTLPFFYHKNWINAQSASDMTSMGQLTFLNYTTLASANGVSSSGVTVSIYAHAKDVRLSGPSVGLAVQSDELQVQSDEYGEGAVSGPASAVAHYAGWFEDWPIIGRFATATRMGASAISSIASLFGFTNVPVIADTMPYRPEAFPHLASTQEGYPVQKLTLDSKNELSIDPSIVGLPSNDEMCISYLASKESYLTTASWGTADNVDDILFSSRVNPMMYDNDGATQSKIYMTPMCWLAKRFGNWRGDIVFKLKIVASPFHKGRLRISYDPSGYSGENIISDAISTNVVFTTIVDLDGSNEIEFRVPYQQATAYLNTRPNCSPSNINWSTSKTPTFAYDPLYDNGTLTVRVSTALTAPVASSTVAILVSVTATHNYEVANPLDDTQQLSTWAVQADTLDVTMGNSKNVKLPEQNLINFGERIVSLRQLLRRSAWVSASTIPADTTHQYVMFRKLFSKIPGMYGYDTGGINSAKGLVVPASNFKFNYSQNHPLTWFLPAFVAYRGSTNWTFNALGGGQPVEHMRVVRNPRPSTLSTEIINTATPGTISANASWFYQNFLAGNSGQALTNQRTNAGLAVQCPNYTQFKFQSTCPTYYTAPTTADGSYYDQFQLELFLSGTGSGPTPANTILNSYVGIGTDFGVHWFLNVPTFWSYSANPTAN
jgi:hypothetical protein